MQTIIRTGTTWYPGENIIVTRLTGDVTTEEIEHWERSLSSALSQVEDNGVFKILVDLYGFKAINFEAHKRFRSIVPLTLAQYGWKVGYTDLFQEEARQIHYSYTRGIRCIRAAHIHQDETKIGLYERSYSRADERYFTNREEAENWLKR